MTRVLLTGAGGQVGSYLAEMLVAEDVGVVGLTSTPDGPLPAGVERARGSLDPDGIEDLLDRNGPLDAVAHFASMTSMVSSWEEPLRTFDINGRAGAALAFEVARRKGLRLVHASSAEIFGRAAAACQDETTPISPVSPYGVAKAAAHMAVRFVRQAYGCPATNLILYMAESPRRRATFVLRKITRTAARIRSGSEEKIVLGNLEAVRDFCHARDVAAAARLFVLGAAPGDYVCASGEGRSIRTVAEVACRIAEIDPARCIESDPSLYRPNDIPSLVGDSTTLRALGWTPRVSFDALVKELVECEAGTASNAGR